MSIELFYFLAPFSTLMSLIVAGRTFLIKGSFTGNYKLFSCYFIMAAAFDVTGAVYFYLEKNNSFLMDVFSIVAYPLVSIAFLKYVGSQVSKRVFRVIIVFIALVSAYFLISPSASENMDLVPYTLQSVSQIFLTAIVLYNFSIRPDINMFHSPVFWFAAGVFIYSLIDSVVTSSTNFLFKVDGKLMTYTWNISLAASIIGKVCYLKGLGWINKE